MPCGRYCIKMLFADQGEEKHTQTELVWISVVFNTGVT